MANNFTLGTAWVDIRANGKNFGADLKGVASGLKAGLRPAHAIASAATGGQGFAGIGAFARPEGAAAGAVLDAAVGAISKLAAGIVSLVEAANPFAVKQLDAAWRDLYAVVGDAFVPVVELARDAVRLMADALVDVMPYIKGFVHFLVGIARPALDALRYWTGATAGASLGRGQFGQAGFGDIAGARKTFAVQALEAWAALEDKNKKDMKDPLTIVAENTTNITKQCERMLEYVENQWKGGARGLLATGTALLFK